MPDRGARSERLVLGSGSGTGDIVCQVLFSIFLDLDAFSTLVFMLFSASSPLSPLLRRRELTIGLEDAIGATGADCNMMAWSLDSAL